MVTIKDVAERAGVSPATVSNYLNRTKPVRKDTENKIKQAIEELQYHQNLSARSLKASVYTDIGVVLPNLHDPYYVQIFQGIEAAFQNTPYFLNLALTYDTPELERKVVNNMLRKQVCGLILVTCCPNDWKFYYENFNRHNRPIVLLDRAIQNLDCNYITFDYKEAMRTMTQSLLQKGCHDIVLLAGSDQYTCENDCIKGFLEAHQNTGIEPRQSSVKQIKITKEYAFLEVASILQQRIPDAIVTTSCQTADGTIEALYLLGYTAEDIRLLSLGQEHWNKYTRTKSTFSTARPAIKMGDTAAHLLLEQIRLPLLTENQRITIPSHMDPGVALQYTHSLQSNNQVFFSEQTIIQMDRVMPRQRYYTSSAKTSDDPITLQVLMPEIPSVHTIRNLVRNFEVLTGIQIQIHTLPHPVLYDAIMQDFRRNPEEKHYDVYMYDIAAFPLLASQGALADITDYVSHIGEDVFLPGYMDLFGSLFGRQYGLPFAQTPQILYYRKDLFEDISIQVGFEKLYGSKLRPPLTFTEFNAIADYFTFHTDAVAYGCSVTASDINHLTSAIYPRLLSNGGCILDESGNVQFNTPETLRAYVSFMRTLAVAKPDYRTATNRDAVNDFQNGETAMLISYPSFMTNSVDLGNIGYCHIPGRRSLIGGWGIGVSSRSCCISEAVEFVKWTCSEQMSGYFALTGSLSAVSNTYSNDELVNMFPMLPLYQTANMNSGTVFPLVINGNTAVPVNSIDEIVCRWAYEMIDKKCSVEDAIQNTQAELEALIAQEISAHR